MNKLEVKNKPKEKMSMSIEKATIVGKRIECWIGILFLLTPVIACVGLFASWLGLVPDGTFHKTIWHYIFQWYNIDGIWDTQMTVIFIALMSFVGAYLAKDNFKYLFIELPQESQPEEQK